MTALHPPQHHQVPAPPPQRPRGPRGLIIALIITAVIAVVAITALVTVQLTSNDTKTAVAPATTTAAPATDSPLEARAAAKAKTCSAYNTGVRTLQQAALPGITPQNWDSVSAAEIARSISVRTGVISTFEAGIDSAAGPSLSATMRTLVDKMRESNASLERRDAQKYLAANSAASAAATGVEAVCAA